MKNAGQATDEGLVRAIGTWALGDNIVNMVVGPGIFVLPGIVAAQLGPAALIAYLVCAVIVGLIFLCHAEVAAGYRAAVAAMPTSRRPSVRLPGRSPWCQDLRPISSDFTWRICTQ